MTETSYAIVAIASEGDEVWHISSDKKPHLTLLYLGDHLNNLDRVKEYIAHAVDTSLRQFGMNVDHRGTLGPKSADVLFFGDYGRQTVEDFRGYLLRNHDIAEAYHSTDQFPEYVPHLTMGMPDDPAQQEDRGSPNISWVNFDKIALWTGDSEGDEFPLSKNDSFAMNDRDGMVLKHYGIKGMHWGIRRDHPSSSSPVEVETKFRPGRLVTTTGGQHFQPHEDAVRVAVSRQKARKSSTDALSTKELQDLVSRMNLEQQYSNLLNRDPRNTSDAQKFIKKTLQVGKTLNDVHKAINSPAGKLALKAIKTKLNH